MKALHWVLPAGAYLTWDSPTSPFILFRLPSYYYYYFLLFSLFFSLYKSVSKFSFFLIIPLYPGSPSVSCILSFISLHYYSSYFPFPLLHHFHHIFIPTLLHTLFLSFLPRALFIGYISHLLSYSHFCLFLHSPLYVLLNSLFTFSPPPLNLSCPCSLCFYFPVCSGCSS